MTQTFNSYNLLACGMTPQDSQIAFANAHELAEKSDEFFIGFTFNWWCCYSYPQYSVGKVNYLTLSSIGVNSQ